MTENEELIDSLQKNREAEKVFLNPNSRDALIGNLLCTETYNAIAGKPAESSKNQVGDPVVEASMKVAKKDLDLKINTEFVDIFITNFQILYGLLRSFAGYFYALLAI